MSHHTVDYASMIREKGHRLTPQREMVLDAVCESCCHATFDEVYRRVKEKSAAIDRSTVYRSLDFLAEMQLISVSEIDGGRVYEIAVGQPAHHHLVCRACGADIEIPHNLFSALFESISREYGFAVDTHHLILDGLCQACQESN